MAQGSRPSEWLSRNWSLLVTILTALLAVLFSPFGVDVEFVRYAALLAFAIFGLWYVWEALSTSIVAKVLLSILIAGGTVGWGYLLYRSSQPHFEITALDTLEGDPNAYELTDQLIWNQNNLDQYGVAITFTLEIRPNYYGRQKFGQVVALISGDSNNPPLEKPLWRDFTTASSTKQLQLTLPEILGASGLKLNSNPPRNPFRTGDLPFEQARLIVQVARQAAKTRPWSTKEITIRNAPWELRSDLVWRDGRREADVYVKNLGGPGGFTVRYRLVRLEKEIDSSELPEVSGTTYITAWNAPRELIYLERGEFFTDTVSLPAQLAQGRYLLEIYAVKKQDFVQFDDPNTTWENVNSMNSPWWFGEYPSAKHLFVVTTSEFPEDPTIQAEWKRLKDEQGVDLGLALKAIEEVTSATGAKGQRQVFQQGEIYLYNGQAYALYGPILEHYNALGGAQYERLGFPISLIQAVTSSSGAEGHMMEFEGPGPPNLPTLIYASRKGVAAVWMWIRWVYSGKNGGHDGWLGFPLADEQYFPDSASQMFESGYIVYQYPYVEGKRDYREPVAYPYLASRGTLFDVHAEQPWQNTGVQLQPGDRVAILQVEGAWTNRQESHEPFDANGNAAVGLRTDAPLPTAVIGTLIGKIGEDNSQVFSMGRWSVLTPQMEGTLYLTMNDNDYGDNAGFITVQIMVEPSD